MPPARPRKSLDVYVRTFRFSSKKATYSRIQYMADIDTLFDDQRQEQVERQVFVRAKVTQSSRWIRSCPAALVVERTGAVVPSVHRRPSGGSAWLAPPHAAQSHILHC